MASTARLSRYADKEIDRIRTTEGFKLFSRGEKDTINDTDFYAYLGITPRTSKNDFLGRLNTVSAAVKELSEIKERTEFDKAIVEYHHFLVKDKFKDIIEYFNEK